MHYIEVSKCSVEDIAFARPCALVGAISLQIKLKSNFCPSFKPDIFWSGSILVSSVIGFEKDQCVCACVCVITTDYYSDHPSFL